MITKMLAPTAAVLTLLVLAAPWALAQSGAKALFYGSSGAMIQSNAPVSGPTMSRTPDAPGSNLATGFPSGPPAMPGMPPPPPTMPVMTPPPPPPTMPAMTPPPPPDSGAQAGTNPADDATKIMDELRAAAASLPPSPGGPASPTGPVAGVPAAEGTKDLAVVGPAMGVRYWVELVDARGNRRQVTTEQVFRAGDRIKLHLMSNRDGYLTLVNIGSSGRATVLFPSTAAGGNNFVRAGTDYEVPPGGYLRFDATPGQETLVLTFSPTPTPAPTASGALAMARGGKDLLTEVDASSPQPATYAVAPGRAGNTTGTVAVQIKLNHQ